MIFFFLDHEEQDTRVNRQETQTTAFIYAEGVLFMSLFFLKVVKPGERGLTAPLLADMVCSEQSWRRAWVCGKFCQQM